LVGSVRLLPDHGPLKRFVHDDPSLIPVGQRSVF
jgi:hypothetical protein